ncbi:hypothetical protein CUMW_140390 [Citrus unshiu]|uniref:Uncharacterized protein n=1 Tax=Citrus unshiu TaxID=55188 RepID=A0A2H5PIT8_CITUN|nr:hypothetical protein CUMW_140390 [Citrus unshiu]
MARVGWVNGEGAAVIIEKENPYVNAIVIPKGAPVPQDFRCDRVRVAVNNDGKVVEAPPHPWMVSFVHGQLECISKINEQVVLFNKACMDKLVIQKSSQ